MAILPTMLNYNQQQRWIDQQNNQQHFIDYQYNQLCFQINHQYIQQRSTTTTNIVLIINTTNDEQPTTTFDRSPIYAKTLIHNQQECLIYYQYNQQGFMDN
jgi:hypothetical protein